MAYDSLEQHDHDLDDPDCDVDGDGDIGLAKNSQRSSLHQPAAAVRALRQIVQPGRSRSQTDSSYEMVEDDDYEGNNDGNDLTLTLPSRSVLPSTEESEKNSKNKKDNNTHDTPSHASKGSSSSVLRNPIPLPVLRTAVPAAGLALRHPTPVDDQRVRLASYTDKIEHLERTAERLSMTSSIDDAIRDLHGELKRNDSRRSPLRSSPDVTISTRAADSAKTAIDTTTTHPNLAAGVRDKAESITTSSTGGLARSASKSSRFGTRPEPELAGRPLYSFVNSSSSPTAMAVATLQSPAAPSPRETTVDKEAYTPMDRQGGGRLEVRNPEPTQGEGGRQSSPSSTDSFDAEKMFAGFDGTHAPPQQSHRVTIQEPVDVLGISPRRASLGPLLTVDGIDGNRQQRPVKDRLSFVADPPPQRQPRISSAERMSMARSQSYEDPETGQQMLYYPAPVPVMLNLPQKLSKAPSSMARSKRRTQALSAVPAPARQTAIWLPDVLEIEDHPGLPENDETQQLEYVPQHQRMSMGGRRVPHDVQHLPAQLRATAFFDQQAPEQVVELKEQSAVATLDSILDASAHAPVTAFTDHLIAGHLGAEVYGQPKTQNRGSTANLLSPEEKAPPKKRMSAFNLLGRRPSGGNALDAETEKKRAAMIADIRAGKIIRDDDEEEAEESEHEEEPEEVEYHGAPTTLLAEIQLRKQQQKHRTRPIATAYPNGLHSTLLELDAVAQAEAETRKQKRVTLAWEGQAGEESEEDEDDDDDVPLALIYAKNAKKAQELDINRPIGLIERRDMEDNEPLSRRRDRLLGKVPNNRASLLSVLPPPPPPPPPEPEDEGETLAERLARLKGDGEEVVTDLPKARPVSGDFASEMLSQFGGDLADAESKDKGKESPADEEEETLGQRRKRLQAEARARAAEMGEAPAQAAESPSQPDFYKRHSMADILHHHPQAGATRMAFQTKPQTGLLGLNERMGAQRSSTFHVPSRATAGGFKGGKYNDGQAGTAPRDPRQNAYNPYNTAALHQFPQPTLGYPGAFGGQQPLYNPNMMFAGPYANAGFQAGAYPPSMPISYLPQMQNTMASMGMLNMGGQPLPLNQGQIDMVERWRQSVMQ